MADIILLRWQYQTEYSGTNIHLLSFIFVFHQYVFTIIQRNFPEINPNALFVVAYRLHITCNRHCFIRLYPF